MMPEKNQLTLSSSAKITALENHRKELCDKVKFSDLSHHLITCGHFNQEDTFSICSLPLEQQMNLVLDKIIRILETENDPKKSTDTSPTPTTTIKKTSDIWTFLLRALNLNHFNLTCKLDSDFHKILKREKPRRLTKEDIGSPSNFKHLKHIGQLPTPSSDLDSSGNKSSPSPLRRFFSLRSGSSSGGQGLSLSPGSSSSSGRNVNEQDPELKVFFGQAGFTNDPIYRKLILDFIEKNGGMDAMKRELRLKSSGSSSGVETDESPLSSPLNMESQLPSSSGHGLMSMGHNKNQN